MFKQCMDDEVPRVCRRSHCPGDYSACQFESPQAKENQWVADGFSTCSTVEQGLSAHLYLELPRSSSSGCPQLLFPAQSSHSPALPRHLGVGFASHGVYPCSREGSWICCFRPPPVLPGVMATASPLLCALALLFGSLPH